MKLKEKAAWVVGAMALGSFGFAPALAGQREIVRDGAVSLFLSPDQMEHAGISMYFDSDARRVNPLSGDVQLLVSDATDVEAVFEDGKAPTLLVHHFQVAGGLRIVHGAAEALVSDFVLVNEVPEEASAISDISAPLAKVYLELRGFRTGLGLGEIVVPAESISIPMSLALKLGDAHLAGRSLGTAVLQGSVEAVRIEDGDQVPVPVTPNVPSDTASAEGSVAAPGPDMTFCQLYGLQQYGRLGDIVGLAIGTTSWNIGGRDMIWMQNPDNRHPFIVWNMYRLKNDRFEQIGMSHVKHGFFALGNTQCGGTCTYEPGHGVGDWLGQGCTDTYDPSLNASQSGLGPRYEINAWTGAFTYAGSHLSVGHSHNAIQHRCQVHDADLDPAQNGGATYYGEGQYITIDDVNPANSISWKTATVFGSPGGIWTFGMSGAGTMPNTGPALNAWTGARQTVMAQQVPVIRFSSPDGRCILAAKETDLGGGQWHYEYALYNMDMHRKARSFSVPLPSGVTVSNIGFHAVESHNEPFSNVPWTPVVDSNSITWSTVDNPIRWGMLYNFRFDVDAPPGDVTATVGLYEPGTPDSISGVTTGPFLVNPSPDPQADPSGIDKNRFISFMVPPAATAAAGLPTALRVTLTSLHHVDPPYLVGAAADFTAFEGEVRWVGPPTEYMESSSSSETFHAAMLQCAPHYQDWSTVTLLHVTGREIVPSSLYTIENLAAECQGIEESCTQISAALEIPTNRWGDLIAPFSSPDPPVQPDFTDVSALVDKFRSIEGAPIKARALLAGDIPNLVNDVDFSNISAGLDAFKGYGFPYSGPGSCP